MKIRYEIAAGTAALAGLILMTFLYPNVPQSVRITLSVIVIAATGAFFTNEWRRSRRTRTAVDLFCDCHRDVIDELESFNSQVRITRYVGAWTDQCVKLLAAGAGEEEAMKRMTRWACENMATYLTTPNAFRA